MSFFITFQVTYYCGEGNTARALQCMNDNNVDPAFLANEARSFEGQGLIDDLSNLDNTKVVIIQGELDSTVVPGMIWTEKCNQFLREFWLIAMLFLSACATPLQRSRWL